MNPSWKIRVLLAALRLGRDFRPIDLGLSSLSNAAGAVAMLVAAGELEWIKGGGACQWTYRLTESGRTRAKLHTCENSNGRPKRKSLTV